MSASAVPTVSVVVPTHNRADLIGETLKSVLAQTFRDFEIIVVDNGSTDGTDRVVKALEDPRIRYYWQEDSGLPANSRNVGIRLSCGRYIAFLDSDDLWLPGKLALQVEYMDAHPAVGLICTNAMAFDTNGPRGRLSRIDLNWIGLTGHRAIRQLLRGNFVFTLTVMVRRACLDVVGLFNENPVLRTVEDFELWLRLGARFPLVYLPAVTAYHRVHAGALAGSDRVASVERAIGMLKGLLPVFAISPRQRTTALASHYRHLARERAMAGDQLGAIAAAREAWRADPGLRSGILLAIGLAGGKFLGQRLLPWLRRCKYSLDRFVAPAAYRLLPGRPDYRDHREPEPALDVREQPPRPCV